MRSKIGVLVCQLECEGGEYEVEVAAIFEVARTKERGSEAFFGENPLSDCLSDCRFPRPGEPIEPEDRRRAEIFGP